MNQDAQEGYWPDDMPDDIVEKRMYAPAPELVKSKLVDPRSAGDALKSAKQVVFCAEWGATQAELAEELLPSVGSGTRVVMLSRVGINRKDKVPFEEQNKPPKKLQEVALGLKLPTGENSGQPGTLDGFGNAEKILTAAAAKRRRRSGSGLNRAAARP